MAVKRVIIKSIAFLLIPLLCFSGVTPVKAQITLNAASAILIEASTGQVIFEKEANIRRSPASITKIMTLLLAFEQLDEGKISLNDKVIVSEYASSMGGSQVFLAQGEEQTLDTMLKCIAVASGNDACVAVAEHISGSEEAFVERMNEKALELGMVDTHFVDCCGLTDSDEHFTTARDVATMSRELIVKYPQVFDYTKIWMENITHNTPQGSSIFGLSSTNKLLKSYQWTTGLKTGSTQKAKYCISATANKDGIELIAVVMGAPDPKTRFSEAQTLLTYGYGCCKLYVDDKMPELPKLPVDGGKQEEVAVIYEKQFRYLDVKDVDFQSIQNRIELPEKIQAPISEGERVGKIRYYLGETEIGTVDILCTEDVDKAFFADYLKKTMGIFLL